MFPNVNHEKSDPQITEKLEGSIEHVTFHHAENGFCVLRVSVKNRRDWATVVGNLANPTPGEQIEATGHWVNDKKHGLQFKATHLSVQLPVTLTGIEKYLASGMVHGIGAHFAKKLVHAFGDKLFETIENHPERLLQLEGIGEKRKKQILNAWQEQKSVRDIMLFLQTHGVGTNRAIKIYKTYGDQAIDALRANPYRLALDIRGIGFKTADNLAQALGIPQDSPIRAQAGIRHVILELCNHGHCATPRSKLVSTSANLLEIDTNLIENAIDQQLQEKYLVSEEICTIPHLFPIHLYRAEAGVAQQLTQLMDGIPPWGDRLDAAKAMAWTEKKTGLQLSLTQQHAITQTLQHKVSIITGGPGVGKTTILKSLIAALRGEKMGLALCAPTGRAAKRLSEATGLNAQTIHRLLEFDPSTHQFKHHQSNPLGIDVLIIDEASMLDIVLFHQLLKAIPLHAALLLVGDVDQLPSVSPGAVLADLIESQQIPTIKLTEIFRQATNSQIITNAHRINQGQMPLPGQKNSDFYVLYQETAENIHDTVIDLVATRIPQAYEIHPRDHIQVLTPMNRGSLGAVALNIALQKKLNHTMAIQVTRYGWTFSPGDKVIQTVNNYDKEVFNGDIGIISHIHPEDQRLQVSFEGRLVDYHFDELDELNLAYAITIHKSQGSEFPIVVIPLANQHYLLLAKNLLYTGITRGKNLVILVCQKRAIAMAVNNNSATKRITRLSQRLKEQSIPS